MGKIELENWLESLGEMDLTVKVSAVGVTLNRIIHWESGHRVIEMLDLHDSSDRHLKAEDEGVDYSRGPASTKPMMGSMSRLKESDLSPSSPVSRVKAASAASAGP